MNEPNVDATAIFAPIWKRKWLILIVGVLVAAGAYEYYRHKPSVYGASTQIYLGGNTEAQSLIGGANTAQSPVELADQAELINSNVVGEAVQRQLRKEDKLAFGQGTVKATATKESDFIDLSAEAGSAEGAATLANTYAQVYLRERSANYRHQLEALLASVHKQLQSAEASIPKSAAARSPEVATLIERTNELKSELDVGDTGDRQINPAAPNPVALSPNPKRNAIFGGVLGIVLACIVAYAASRFDRRMRSLGDIESVFQVPVVAAVPSSRKPIGRADGVPTLAKQLREPMRRLHTTMHLREIPSGLNGHSTPRSVLFISAGAGDGKSTVLAALALVQSEAGARVAVIDADMRRPVQGKLLNVEGSQGLAEVLSGKLTFREALQRVGGLPSDSAPDAIGRTGSLATAVQAPETSGSVSLLAGGDGVANPPALLVGPAMPALVRSAMEEFDYVLIDAPPPLEVSDVLPLMAMVDAMVVVARVGHTGERAARRLVDLLAQAPHSEIIGAVANDASTSEMEAFGLSSAYYEPRGRRS
jgi:succinoglycan biosynthesis transport protein ExoP